MVRTFGLIVGCFRSPDSCIQFLAVSGSKKRRIGPLACFITYYHVRRIGNRSGAVVTPLWIVIMERAGFQRGCDKMTQDKPHSMSIASVSPVGTHA